DEGAVVPAIGRVHVWHEQLAHAGFVQHRTRQTLIHHPDEVEDYAKPRSEAQAELPVLPVDLTVVDADSRSLRLNRGYGRGVGTRVLRDLFVVLLARWDGHDLGVGDRRHLLRGDVDLKRQALDGTAPAVIPVRRARARV